MYNETITAFCTNVLQNATMTEQDKTWQWIQYKAWSMNYPFLIAFIATFFISAFIGATMLRGKRFSFGVFIASAILGTMAGFTAMWISTNILMNGG